MTQWAAEPGAANTPEYTKDNQLVFPSNYREWIFLSSGLGIVREMQAGKVGVRPDGRSPRRGLDISIDCVVGMRGVVEIAEGDQGANLERARPAAGIA